MKLGDLTIHLSTCEEVDNLLFVFLYKLFKLLLIGSLNSQNKLRSSIYIFCILKCRFGIYITHIHYNNVAY